MLYRLVVPPADASVDEIRVLEWHGGVGRKFETDEMVVELETHKAIVEVRAGQPGYLREILTPEGAWQEIGKPIGVFSDAPDEPAAPADAAPELLVAFEIS